MLPKSYDPKPVEEKYAALWQEKSLFLSHIPEDKNKKSYVIVIPPPNITGALHMGHALNDTIQDALVRAQRMFGREAYWVPGTDHGGIATQNVMEKKLGKDRHIRRQDLGRDKFLEEMWQWYRECGSTILGQLNKLGCALDLSADNVRFTMDEKRAQAVFESFKRLWAKNLIYRGERMINWCVRCGTALSDIEVEHEESNSKLWHIKYPLEDGTGFITVATTRPETMLGDTGVAVHPEDGRYKDIVGRKVRLPLAGRLIPIIADEGVDKEFGTGAVKVTPAHDPLDFEIGQRQKLETVAVISFEGKMINVPEKYSGMDRTMCRHAVVEDLKTEGLLEKEEHYHHSVSCCDRCHQPIEPLTSEQWFVSMKGLAAPAIKAVEENRVTFHPESWKKPQLDWLNNIQDWCISRQIWWGHRIPVWYCRKCSGPGLIFDKTGGELKRVSFKDGAKPIVSFGKPAACPDCGGADLVQDPDVLDTWFSSALWPFSVFNWPDKTPELAYYYPTSVLVTGYEILYLWVARMIMMGLEFMGDVPFKDVYVHGIVRDKHGKKMSKSLGNGIDPLDMMQKYGTDAVRFSLISQAMPGKDIPFGEESITGARNFSNKIYNAARFIQMNMGDTPRALAIPDKLTHLSDKWLLHRYNAVTAEAKLAVENYDVASAANALYHFLWDEYCDWYVELAKPRLQAEDKDAVLSILVHVLYGTLKALHPFMPFITEELAASFRPWTRIDGEFLLCEPYPVPDSKRNDPAAAAQMETIMGVTTAIRTVRSHFSVPPAMKINCFISGKRADLLAPLKAHPDYVALLAKIEKLELGEDIQRPPHSATAVYRDLTVFAPLEGIIDFGKERERLVKELEKLEKEAGHCKERLADSTFRERAPEVEVKRVESRLSEALQKISQVESAVKDLA